MRYTCPPTSFLPSLTSLTCMHLYYRANPDLINFLYVNWGVCSFHHEYTYIFFSFWWFYLKFTWSFYLIWYQFAGSDDVTRSWRTETIRLCNHGVSRTVALKTTISGSVPSPFPTAEWVNVVCKTCGSFFLDVGESTQVAATHRLDD